VRERPLLSIEEAAAYLGVTPRWMRRAVERRTLPHIKLGRLVRFDQADLEAYLAEQRVEPAGER
jgi:excisionase family DNA binding protein